MKNDYQGENFISGTVNIFLALAFITVIPLIVNNHVVFVPALVYKIFCSIALVVAAIFYFKSSSFYKYQTIVIASVFLIFSIFQLASPTTAIAVPLKFAPLFIGAGIFWFARYDKKELS